PLRTGDLTAGQRHGFECQRLPAEAWPHIRLLRLARTLLVRGRGVDAIVFGHCNVLSSSVARTYCNPDCVSLMAQNLPLPQVEGVLAAVAPATVVVPAAVPAAV